MTSKIVNVSTTFVNDSISEVLRTLAEAFVLGSSCSSSWATSAPRSFPTVAVPVSLIGIFVILLAMGYSANMVSLLAMVLAIGIIVDDAIVVVENVERVMEEEPDLSPADATKKAMTQITAPIIAITLVLLSVFVPIAFIPDLSGQLFRRCARCSCATPVSAAESWATSIAGIEKTQNGGLKRTHSALPCSSANFGGHLRASPTTLAGWLPIAAFPIEGSLDICGDSAAGMRDGVLGRANRAGLKVSHRPQE